MDFGTFGDIVMKPMCQPHTITDSQQFRTTTHNRMYNTPLVEFIGPGTSSKSMAFHLHKDWCDIQGTLDILEQAANNGASMPLVIGGKKLGSYIIQSIDKSNPVYSTTMALVSVQVDIKLIQDNNT